MARKKKTTALPFPLVERVPYTAAKRLENTLGWLRRPCEIAEQAVAKFREDVAADGAVSYTLDWRIGPAVHGQQVLRLLRPVIAFVSDEGNSWAARVERVAGEKKALTHDLCGGHGYEAKSTCQYKNAGVRDEWRATQDALHAMMMALIEMESPLDGEVPPVPAEVLAERERCLALVAHYLLFNSQRAVSWHEVQDARNAIRTGQVPEAPDFDTVLQTADLTTEGGQDALSRAVRWKEIMDEPLDLGRVFASGAKDGAEMARESGSDEAPADGWDGAALNAVGRDRLCDSLGLPRNVPDGHPGWRAALAVYAAGCQAGATETVKPTKWGRGP